MTDPSGSEEVDSNSMVCVECFRKKVAQDGPAPCLNPRCYFFERGNRREDSQRDTVFHGQIFHKEVCCDRSSGTGIQPNPSDLVLSPEKIPSEDNSCDTDINSGMDIRQHIDLVSFRLQDSNECTSEKLTQQSSKTRSQSVSLGTSDRTSSVDTKKSITNPEQSTESTETEKTNLLRKRLMSMPAFTLEIAESLTDAGQEESESLVEDAFLSSPLPESTATIEGPNRRIVGLKMVS